MRGGLRGVLSVVDSAGAAFERAWFLLELYIALVGGPVPKLVDVYTTIKNGKLAVGLTDGEAAVDREGSSGYYADKKAREALFPSSIVHTAMACRVESARTSIDKDKAAIARFVGRNKTTMNATIRATFGARDLARLVRQGPVDNLNGPLQILSSSQIRKLSIVPDVALSSSLDQAYVGRVLGGAFPYSLEELQLVGLHPAVIPGICRLLRHRSSRLRALTVKELVGGLGVRDAQELAAGLRRAAGRSIGGVKSLGLPDNHIGDAVAAALASAMEKASELERLYLNHNTMTATGAASIAEGLGATSPARLQDFTIHDNKIGDDGAVALGRALRKHRGLLRLCLGGNGITDVGAIGLAACLEDHTELVLLRLDNNAITDAGALRLAQALSNQAARRLPAERSSTDSSGTSGSGALSELVLRNNAVGDTGAKAIAVACRVHPGMRRLDIGHNGVSGDGAAVLRDQLAGQLAEGLEVVGL